MGICLSAPQHIFLQGLKTKFRGFVGGFGSGKTFVGCLDLLIFAGQHPRTVQGYFGPTYPSIRDIFYPTLEEAAHLMGFSVRVTESNKEADVYRGGRWYGKIICRSMDNPVSIVGFKIARALVDEIDTLPKEKAKAAWNKIIARMRLNIPGVVNGVGVTTTPEGFLFVYERFALEPKPSYSMVQASTYENQAHLPPDYIETLIETYPAELVKAYLHGEFVNLKSGTVYRNYNRERCRSRERITGQEALFVGMDFNVEHMAATIFVRRATGLHAVGELFDLLDTPDMVRVLRERYAGHKISVYPDASGASRKSVGASGSDLSLLRQAGFTVLVNESNPAVRDRINAANTAFAQGRVWVNDREAPRVARCLEQQAYDKNGEPDKKGGFDHQNDATTYPIAFEMPVRRPYVRAPQVRAF